MIDYIPLDNTFVTYENVETPKIEIELPLLDQPLDITPFVSRIENNIPIIRNNLSSVEEVSDTEESSSRYNNDISFEQLLKEENVPAIITSGFRGKGNLRGGKTAQGRQSNHNKLDNKGNSMAYDIKPQQGYSFNDLRNILYKNPRIVEWFKSRDWGVLEEMQDGKRGFYDTHGHFHYTGATGPHFHIGPDTHARNNYNSKISKAQQGMKVPFQIYESTETPKINLPLLNEPIDVRNYVQYINDNGIPIINNNLNNREEIQQPVIEQENFQQNQPELIDIPDSKGKQKMEELIQEVSKESGFEGLSDPEVKNILMLQAKRESSFNPKAKNPTSTASGYFQFIDKTRQSFSNKTRQEFLNDPKEQIRTAYKYYQYIHNIPQAKQLKDAGYNNTFITTLGWWYPRSMQMVLEGVKNFSFGGYSIKKAFQDYEQNRIKDYFS